MPKERFFDPTNDPARIIGRIDKIQGDKIRVKPSKKPKNSVIRSDFIRNLRYGDLFNYRLL